VGQGKNYRWFNKHGILE